MGSRLIPVNVTIGPAASTERASTVAKLRSAGLRDAKVLDALGIVTGRVAEEKMAALREVPGITVEMDESVQIPPPDQPIQ